MADKVTKPAPVIPAAPFETINIVTRRIKIHSFQMEYCRLAE